MCLSNSVCNFGSLHPRIAKPRDTVSCRHLKREDETTTVDFGRDMSRLSFSCERHWLAMKYGWNVGVIAFLFIFLFLPLLSTLDACLSVVVLYPCSLSLPPLLRNIMPCSLLSVLFALISLWYALSFIWVSFEFPCNRTLFQLTRTRITTRTLDPLSTVNSVCIAVKRILQARQQNETQKKYDETRDDVCHHHHLFSLHVIHFESFAAKFKSIFCL